MADDQGTPDFLNLPRVTPKKEPLTKHERALLKTSYEDLHKRTRVLSFDIDKFKKRITGTERSQQLFYAHLYVDHVITKMLLDALKVPEAIHQSRMNFMQKLDLLFALGLMPKDVAAAVKKLNNLRNNIAHKLDFEITDKMVRDFSNCMPRDVKDAVAAQQYHEGSIRLTFSGLLYALLMETERIRQHNALRRLLMEKEYASHKFIFGQTRKGFKRKKKNGEAQVRSDSPF